MTSPSAPPRRGALRLFVAYVFGMDADRAMLLAALPEIAHDRRVALLVDDATWTQLAPPPDLVRGTPPADRIDLQLVGGAGEGPGPAVEAMLAAGTEVWLALDLRQVPQLVELATSIAGPGPRPPLPATLLAEAAAIELVDAQPDALARRSQATPHPLDRSAVFALRELAMRFAATRGRPAPPPPPAPGASEAGSGAVATPPILVAPSPIGAYAGAMVLLALATGVAAVFDRAGLGAADRVLVYLLAVTAAAAWCGRTPSLVTAVASVLCVNFLFTEPRYTLAVDDPGALFTLGVLLVIGLLVSSLTARLRERTLLAQQRGLRAEQLAMLGQELTGSTGTLQIVAAAEQRLRVLLGLDAAILLPPTNGAARLTSAALRWPDPGGHILRAAQIALAEGMPTGAGSPRGSEAAAILLPLLSPARVLGVLAVRADPIAAPADADRRRLLEAFAAQIALALQRDLLTEQVHRTLAEAEHERLRSALLSSVSHDLRTPLAAITGTASNLLDAPEVPREARREMLATIHGEAERLSRLVDNLLQMTRIQSGRLEPAREWHVVEDLIGSALTRVARLLGDRPVKFAIGDQLPMVRVDGVLIELLLVNVLENAMHYTPAGSPIEVSAEVVDGRLLIAIADRGPGLGDEERNRVFEKFYRGPAHRTDGSCGSGLGLAIGAAIAALHGGTMFAENRADGGARFTLALPIEDQPPDLDDSVPANREPAADA